MAELERTGLPVAAARALAGCAGPVDERWVEVEPGVELRLWHWTPRQASTARPVVLVPGWISVVEGWLPVLERLVQDREVWYLETREKPSARIRRPVDREAFRLDRLGRDLREIWRRTPISSSAVVLASSMGANAVLEALAGDGLRVGAAFLIGVNSRFELPRWGPWLFRCPAALYSVVREPIIWYLRHFRVDGQRNPEQMRRYERALRAADPRRLRLSAQAIVGYELGPWVESIRVPVALAWAESDALHGGAAVRELAQRIPAAEAIPFDSNAAMHRAGVVDALDRFADRCEEVSCA